MPFIFQKLPSNVKGLKHLVTMAPNGSDDYEWWDAPRNVPCEFSAANREVLGEALRSLGDRCHCILEIGVHRNSKDSSTWVLVNGKPKKAMYLGVDIEDKSFLDKPENNVYTLRTDSKNRDEVIAFLRTHGHRQIDLLHIDGYHSINMSVNDWMYTEILAPGGIVVVHDTNAHPGPLALLDCVDEEMYDVRRHFEDRADDWGITTFTRKPTKMRIALCLSGNLRSFEYSAELYRSVFMDELKPDVFMHAWEDGESALWKSAVETYQPVAAIAAGTNSHDPNIVQRIIAADACSRKAADETVVKNVISMWYSMKAVNDMKRAFEEQNGFTYDCVIRCRYDLQLDRPLERRYVAYGDVCIPEGHDYRDGLNDRFALGPSQTMDVYATLYDNFEAYVDNGVLFHPETMLKHHLSVNQVPIKRFPMGIKLVRGIDSEGRLMLWHM